MDFSFFQYNTENGEKSCLTRHWLQSSNAGELIHFLLSLPPSVGATFWLMWKQCLGSRNFSVSFYFFLPFPSSSFFFSFFVFNFVLAILSEVLRLKGNPPFLFYFFLLYLIFFLVCRYRSIGHVEEGEIHPLEGHTTFLHSQTDHPSNTQTNLERVAYSLQEKTIFTVNHHPPNPFSSLYFVSPTL